MVLIDSIILDVIGIFLVVSHILSDLGFNWRFTCQYKQLTVLNTGTSEHAYIDGFENCICDPL